MILHIKNIKMKICFPKANDASVLADWYINKKYENIQEELTMNEICFIGKRQMKNLIHKAEIKIVTN